MLSSVVYVCICKYECVSYKFLYILLVLISIISTFLYFHKNPTDLQCSTEEEDDEFQEVSEDENSAANILDQGERIHSMSNAGGSEEGGSDLLVDSANMKTEMKIEAPQLGGGICCCIFYYYNAIHFINTLKS